MNLVIRGVSLNDQALSQPLIGRFDERGGSIGRSDNASMTLPDPERLISRVQANVSFGASTYWLEDVGSANPVLHNGLPLGPGVKVPLKPNDDLRIGGYRLAVEYEQLDNASTIVRGRAETIARQVVPPTPAPGPAIPARVGRNPFSELLGSDTPKAPPADAARAFKRAMANAESAASDPLEMFDAPKRASQPAPPEPVSGPVPVVAEKATPAHAAKQKSANRKAPPADASPRRVAPGGPAASTPGVPSTFTADEIWSGFLDGAGVDIPLPRGVTPDMMRTIGVMLRASIEGMLELIAVRSAAKNELHAAVTVIQVRENNPLKFSPDATVALMQLLQPPGRGFLPGAEAIRNAMADLQSHQIGTMAGMRAALTGVLDRFQPQLLEGRLSGQSMLDALVPMNRKAKLWDLFLQHYQSIRGDAEEDFHDLFGKAFVAAYNDQIERLSAAQEDPPTAPL